MASLAGENDVLQTGVAVRTYDAAANPEVIHWVPQDARSILDVGCGTGGNARALMAHGRVIDGVTLSDNEARVARAFCRQVLIGNLNDGLPAGLQPPYDVVVCSHVIEHVCFPARMLDDIRSALASTGLLIVAVPNLLFYRNRLRLLLGQFEYTDGGIMDSTHFRWYTLQSLQRLLGAHGFDIAQARGYGIAPLGPLRRLSSGLAGLVDRAVSAAAPGIFGAQFVVVARPRPVIAPSNRPR